MASLYVEILVACGMTRTHLFDDLDRANFFSLIKNDITKRLPKQMYKVLSQLDSCIGATNTWVIREEKQRRKSADTRLQVRDGRVL